MSTLTAVVWVAAALLVVAGGAKAMAPDHAVVALRNARVPAGRRSVRALGAGELTLGLVVLVVGGTAAVTLLAAVYGGFAFVAQRQRRAGSDCGCFGAARTAVTRVHVWLDALLAGCGLVAALLPGPAVALPDLASRQPVAGATAALLLVVVANLLRLLLTAAPELSATIAELQPDAAA